MDFNVSQDSWRELANAFAHEKVLFLLNTANQVRIETDFIYSAIMFFSFLFVYFLVSN